MIAAGFWRTFWITVFSKKKLNNSKNFFRVSLKEVSISSTRFSFQQQQKISFKKSGNLQTKNSLPTRIILVRTELLAAPLVVALHQRITHVSGNSGKIPKKAKFDENCDGKMESQQKRKNPKISRFFKAPPLSESMHQSEFQRVSPIFGAGFEQTRHFSLADLSIFTDFPSIFFGSCESGS